MKKYYNNPKYDVAFDRCANILATLMVKYGPRVLLKQAVEGILGKGRLNIHDPESPKIKKERLIAYQKEYGKICSSTKDVKDKAA